MSFGEKIKEKVIERAVEGIALSLSAILIWICTKIGPIVLPAIESQLSKEDTFAFLLGSLVLNIVFLLAFWLTHKKPEFKLKYGIYWDSAKNPHCPNCRIPIGGYGEYDAGWGYYCKPCGKIFTLTDATGKHIKPQQVIQEI